MARQKQILMSLVSTVLFSSIGCGNKGPEIEPTSPNPQRPPIVSKPLPEACDDKEIMPVDFRWEANTFTFEYRVDFGFEGQVPFDTLIDGNDLEGYIYANGKRGKTYSLQISRQLKNGTTSYAYKSVHIPLCADRKTYQLKNPEYAEPIVHFLQF